MAKNVITHFSLFLMCHLISLKKKPQMLYNNVIQRKAKKPHVCFRNSNNLVIKIVLTI